MSNEQFLVFTNLGEIDPRLITTMGVNVKSGASPIGYFGTGLKYAIAVILRSGGHIKITSGSLELSFASVTETIRGKEFQVVKMMTSDGMGTTLQPLAFTLDLGRNWQLWMATRELWSNCQDEGGSISLQAKLPAPAPGSTTITVWGDQVLESWTSRYKWLLQSNPVSVAGELEIHPGPGLAGYYHGIKVCDLSAPGTHTYNLTGQLRLTEDRTVDAWDFRAKVSQQLATDCQDERMLQDLMLPTPKSFEDGLQWEYIWQKPSELMIEVAERIFDSNPGTMQPGIVKYLQQHMPKRQPPVVDLTKVEAKMLEKALEFLAKLGHSVSAPIRVIETTGSHWIAGLATPEGEIWLPKATFGKGTKFVVSTLLEEHLHISQHLPDCSREMQDWLFDRIMSLGEELQGEPL